MVCYNPRVSHSLSVRLITCIKLLGTLPLQTGFQGVSSTKGLVLMNEFVVWVWAFLDVENEFLVEELINVHSVSP